MDEIIENLWMGSGNPLLAMQVDAIVDCQIIDLTALVPKPFLWVPFLDIPVLPPASYISVAYGFIEFMRLDNKKVLVHCSEGHNRSGLIVACYLIKGEHMTPADAINLVRSKRGPQALSNQTFVNYLMGLHA